MLIRYLFGDSCTIYGTVETVNKKCTKAKVRVAKATQAFGMAIAESCRYDGGEAATGDVVWVSIKQEPSLGITFCCFPCGALIVIHKFVPESSFRQGLPESVRP